MRLKLLLVIFTSLLQFDTISQVSRYGLPITQNFTPKKYGAGIQNWDVVQDSQGLMYFGNNLGLLEYDGINWNLNPVKNATKVRSVLIGNDGKIYVGSGDGFLYKVPIIGDLTVMYFESSSAGAGATGAAGAVGATG